MQKIVGKKFANFHTVLRKLTVILFWHKFRQINAFPNYNYNNYLKVVDLTKIFSVRVNIPLFHTAQCMWKLRKILSRAFLAKIS